MRIIVFAIVALYADAAAGQTGAAKPGKAKRLSDSAVALWDKGKYKDALPVINEAYAIAEKEHDSLQMANCLNNTAIIYNSLGMPGKSLYYGERSLALHRIMGNEEKVYISLLNLGVAYKEQADYDKAFSYLFESATYFSKKKDWKKLSNAYNTIGNIYRAKKEYDKSLKYLSDALALRKALGSENAIAGALSNIGAVYADRKEYDSALFYFNASLKIKLSSDKNKAEKTANTISHIGEVYTATGDFSLAEKYYKESFKLRTDNNHKIGIVRSCYELGNLYFKWKRFTESEHYLLEGNARAKTDSVLDIQVKCCSLLKALYKEKHNYSKALEYAEAYILLYEEMLGKEKQKLLNQLEVKYETEKLLGEIESLSEDKMVREALLVSQNKELAAQKELEGYHILAIVLMGVLITLLIILLTYRSRFAKKLDALMREMHHRVTNNFQVLLSMLHLQTQYVKDAEAKAVLEGNSGRVTAMLLIHKELYRSRNITRADTVIYTRNLVENLQMIYQRDREIEVAYDMDDSIVMEVDKAIVLGLLINELVTNAFKYAFGQDNVSPRLDLLFHRQSPGRYRLCIRDNGPGMKSVSEHRSMGLKLAENQVKQLKGTMHVTSVGGMGYDIKF